MFQVFNDYFLIAQLEQSEILYAKAGSMVAYQGDVKFDKKMLTGTSGNLLKNTMQTFVKGTVGEGMNLMTAKGEGNIYFADKEQYVITVDMNKEGGNAWKSITVEGDKVLAYTQDVHHSVKLSTFGTSSTKGLFTSSLQSIGEKAHVALVTRGKPMYLPTPCYVDPQALVAYTGPAPSLQKNNITWKTLIGKTSGETFVLDFSEPGYFVIVQPCEEF